MKKLNDVNRFFLRLYLRVLVAIIVTAGLVYIPMVGAR